MGRSWRKAGGCCRFAIPIEVKDPKETALKLAPILDLDYDFLISG